MTYAYQPDKPYVELLLSPSSDPRIAANVLAHFGSDLAGEADGLIDLLDESRNSNFVCSVVALFTAIGPSAVSYRRLLSRLDDFASRADDRLRLFWAIATWNADHDHDIAILMMKKFIKDQGLDPRTSESTYERLAAWEFERSYVKQLELNSYPWRLRTWQAADNPEGFLEFYQRLARIVDVPILDDRVADRLELPFESSIYLLREIAKGIARPVDAGDRARHSLTRLLARAGVDDPEALAVLGPLLRDSDNWVREAAVKALCSVRAGDDVVPLLVKALSDRIGEVRSAAAAGLGALGLATPKVTAALVKCVGSPIAAQAMEASAEALCRLGVPEDRVPAEAVTKHFSNAKTWMRKAAARSCGILRLRHPSVVAALKDALRDPKEIVRAYAAASLWTLTGATEEVLPQLLDGLRYRTDDRDMVKTMGLHVFDALEEMAIAGDARAKAAIEGYLDHPDHWMRASRALWRVGSRAEDRSEFTRAFVGGLVERLERGYHGAAILLGETGRDAEYARSALERGAKSPLPRIRYWSTKALRLIDPLS